MSSGSNPTSELPESTVRPNPELSVQQRSIPTTGRRGGSRANAVAEEAIQQGEYRLYDEAAAEVTRLFLDFLHTFTLDILEETSDETRNAGQYYPYKEQVLCLVQGASSMQHVFGVDEIENADDDLRLHGETSTSFPRTLFVDFHHVYAYDVDLAEAIESDFTRFESSLRLALHSYLRSEHFDSTSSTATPMNITREKEFIDSLHIAMINMPSLLPIRRAVRTENIARLICICGTVTRSSDVRPELLIGSFKCSKCSLDTLPVPQQYHYTRPTVCRNPRCDNRTDFQLQFDKSIFTDWQKLRVQENSNEIPPGSMPRSLDVIVRGDMVERAKAGDRIMFTGSLVVIPDASALARAGDAPRATRSQGDAATGGGGGAKGLKSLGVRELTYRTCFVSSSLMPLEHLTRYRNLDASTRTPSRTSFSSNNNPSTGHFSHSPLVSFFHGHWSDHGRRSSALGRSDDEYRSTEEVILEMTEEEQDDIRRMRGTTNFLQKMCQSLAPYTYGHDDIKRGILLQLLGGVHKTTSEGMKLRGDINICIVGDPSTAKSQFLKYVHSFLPNRSVYTSGKASSAAGLTAAVQRDQDTGEFCIEAGALMLADNGICCIDEFDKMDPHDQVSIHEAMEQQTISITKAGIQATLNARASILAAANPIYGRYDRTKTLKANVSLSAPILSRFDLFFVVLDNCDQTSDYHVAKHILDVHRCEEQVIETPFSVEQMQRYIRFARTINPKLSEESRKNLIQYYRMLRQNDALGRGRTAYRITVRQLESMIRLSEAMARLFCDEVVRPQYVRDAYRLLQKSIIHVESDDVTFEDEDKLQEDGVEAEKREQDDIAGPKADEGSVDSVESVSKPVNKLNKQPSSTADKKGDPPPSKRLKRTKKKVKISYEEYVAMMNAMTTYLRSKERKDDSKHLTWKELLEWYLEERESEVSDEEALGDMKRLATLVFHRLVQVERVITFVSDEENELNRKIALHPNFQR